MYVHVPAAGSWRLLSRDLDAIISTAVKAVKDMTNPLHVPRGSWTQLKKIVRAYGEVQEIESPTVEQVAKLAGLLRPVVSGNNEFLRDIGVLAREGNKLTDDGMLLARSLALENEGLITESLQAIVRANPSTLGQWVSTVRARGSIKLDMLQGTIAMSVGVTEKSRFTVPVNTILDLLQEARLIQIEGDIVKTAVRELELQPVPPPAFEALPKSKSPEPPKIPLPLGPTRLAYVQLPADWQSKELPKLMKLLEIALGDSEEN